MKSLGGALNPAPPPIAARFELIAQLREAGHSVTVGINPLVPEWLPEPGELVERLAAAGVWGVWVERLHLNRQQVERMTTAERTAIGAEILRRAQQYKSSQADLNHFHRTRAAARLAGLAVYSHGQPEPSQYWQPFEAMYSPIFPTVQGLINPLAAGGDGVLSFAEFAAYFAPKLPAGELPLGYYFGATSRDIFRRRAISRLMSYEDVLAIIWDDPRTKFSLLRGAGFAFVREGGRMVVDDAARPFVAWREQGFNDYWLDV